MLEEFRQGKSHKAMVVDEFGATAGMVTIEDVLQADRRADHGDSGSGGRGRGRGGGAERRHANSRFGDIPKSDAAIQRMENLERTGAPAPA